MLSVLLDGRHCWPTLMVAKMTTVNDDGQRWAVYRPREDERLSWPCWLTYSGRFTQRLPISFRSGADQ